MPSVVFDFARGEARLGPITVAAAPFDRHGAVQVNGRDGPVLRPLRFGERTRVVAWAAASPRPRDEVCLGVLAAATVRAGTAERRIQEIAALALAGADRSAPPFDLAAMQVGRAGGWTLEDIDAAVATDIDRMARRAAPSEGPAPWRRIVLMRDAAGEIEALRAELADRLLGRLDEAAAADPQAAASGAPPPPGQAIDASATTRRPEPSGADSAPARSQRRPAAAPDGSPARELDVGPASPPDRNGAWAPGGAGWARRDVRIDPPAQAFAPAAARVPPAAETGARPPVADALAPIQAHPSASPDAMTEAVAAATPHREEVSPIGRAGSPGKRTDGGRSCIAAQAGRQGGAADRSVLAHGAARIGSRHEPRAPASAGIALAWPDGAAVRRLRAIEAAEPVPAGPSGRHLFPGGAAVPAPMRGTTSESVPRRRSPPPPDSLPLLAPVGAAQLAPAGRADIRLADALEWADRIALLLDEEADLRGIDR